MAGVNKLVRRHGSWYYIAPSNLKDGEDNIIYMVDELSFCFYYNNGEGTLFKHGELDKINKWLTKTREDLAASPCPLYDPDKFVVITTADWDEVLVNKFLGSRDYIGYWWSEELKKPPKIAE